jgi:hypothetical protein
MGRVFNVDKKGQLTVAAAILLALITLFTSYDHITIPGAHASLQLPQQAGIPLLAAAVAAAVGEAQLASNSRAESAEVRDRTEAEAARRAQLQARCTLVQLQHQLDPTPEHTRQLRGLIAFLLEYQPFI